MVLLCNLVLYELKFGSFVITQKVKIKIIQKFVISRD